MDLTKRTVAVTGASGMLGVYLCRALLKRGCKVIGVVRNPEKAAFLAREGVVFRKADLTDRAALTEAFRGTDAVISNAALFNVRNQKWADNYQANKEGTENVYEAAAAAKVRRMLQVSTFGIYQFKPGKRLIEESPQLDGSKRQGGAYRATKQLSEGLAWALAGKYRIDLTVLRPTGIYGARDQNTMAIFRPLMKLPVSFAATSIVPLVYAGDVAEAAAEALANDASIGKAYNTGGGDESVGDFMRAWKRAAEKKLPLLVPVPAPLRFLVDNSRAERDLRFRNRPFEDALREIFAEEHA